MIGGRSGSGSQPMKITVDIDCTPQEASDLDKMKRNIEEGVTPDTVQAMLKSWAPMGEAGMLIWRQLTEQVSKASKGK
jgi:hypothetical protein